MAYRYKTMKVDGKTKLVHRHKMERHLGRKLRRDEHVHHKNGDRYDNRIRNLEVLSSKDHQHHHKQRYPLTKNCPVCTKEFTPKPTKRKRAKTCSLKCSYVAMWRTRRANQKKRI